MSALKLTVIKPFKVQTLLDKKGAENLLLTLKLAIDQIYKEDVSKLYFEELYRTGYNIVLHKHGAMLYSEVSNCFQQYIMISKEEINRSHDSNILETTLKCWEYQKRNIAMVRDIVMYLDRTYVVFQKLVPIYEMGICIFREKIIHDPSIGERLRTVILANITNERNGELIDTLLLRGILGMYLELGVGGENVYDKEFEAPFLAMTRDYYREESLQFISQNNCIEYIKKVEIRLSQENERVNNYMAKTTKPKLKQIIENELITLRAKALIDIEYSGFNVMLRDNKLDDIKALYILFCKVPQNLELLRNRLRAYIKTTGEHIILDQERLKESSLIFIQKLLDLKLKYDLIIKISFHNDTRMAKILKESFEEFLNLNNNIAAYLASYIDELMKTMLKDCTDTESEEKLEPIIVIFRHIHDKDIFENFHKNYLAKRLLNGKSGTYDIEKSFIAKLKSECGYQYTAKLEGMFADMKISKDIMDAYRNTQLYRDSSIQLDVNTLTSGFWPSSNYKLCVLPSCIMSSCCDSFTSFYLTKHTGRKLHWQLNLGTADIKASFKMGKRELTVSTYQMCILMLFNDCGSSSLSFQFLRDATNIPEPEFRRHLLSLCTPKFKILNKSSKSKGICDDDTFQFNEMYTSKLKRVKIPLISSKDAAVLNGGNSSSLLSSAKCCGDNVDAIDISNSAVVSQFVEEDRRHILEAVIVRIMKARKQLAHNDLISEVVRQTSHRFTSDVQVIKKRIESLIERDYLIRDGSDRRLYIYVA